MSEAGLPSTVGPQPNDLCHDIAYTYLSKAINDIHFQLQLHCLSILYPPFQIYMRINYKTYESDGEGKGNEVDQCWI